MARVSESRVPGGCERSHAGGAGVTGGCVSCERPGQEMAGRGTGGLRTTGRRRRRGQGTTARLVEKIGTS